MKTTGPRLPNSCPIPDNQSAMTPPFSNSGGWAFFEFPTVLFTTTFWNFPREFSPHEEEGTRDRRISFSSLRNSICQISSFFVLWVDTRPCSPLAQCWASCHTYELHPVSSTCAVKRIGLNCTGLFHLCTKQNLNGTPTQAAFRSYDFSQPPSWDRQTFSPSSGFALSGSTITRPADRRG